jgi:DNA-binding response OmpR family regulator
MAKHILIVDDTKALADSISDILRMEGFRVSVVSNGDAAISFLDIESPDLIITDLLMPGINGLEFIRYVRLNKRYSAIPIILLTAQTSVENRSASEQVGANLFIEKPFDEGELLKSIGLLLPD